MPTGYTCIQIGSTFLWRRGCVPLHCGREVLGPVRVLNHVVGLTGRCSGMEVRSMLVLSRKTNQIIDIDSGIEICVIEIRGDKVRLGINAPHDVKIYRREVVARMQHQKQESTE